ncbi:hypothetical protein M413DRAFT_448192 [Hebeloma cylindrosporum]|uniref:Sugar phosphate phosphatase n=1 Tax=Hebeloma cylindrosporum TaxID=76867 RepID=A0A0C3C2T7_HEBCY|nr:hypothetical protein M413DRAFT_448192 [Hebeloma cylindrosporum h7]
MTFASSYPPYDPTDISGFSYETVVKRWPIILAGVVNFLHNKCHTLSLDLASLDGEEKVALQKKLTEGTGIIEKVSKLKYEMARDRALERIPEDGEANVELYNAELAGLEDSKRNTWFTAPWLFAECYLYRLLRAFFVLTEHWKSEDPFYEQKVNTFRQSGTSILHIATTMHELGSNRETVKADPEKLKVLFNEMIQMCLWGNATDLSLLTHLSQADIQHLQSVGKDAQVARQKFILKDDEEPVWKHIQTLKDGRVDFVLDNSGFELFTDLVFADFLVTYTPYVSKVVCHPKLIPWFVSDVTPPDFRDTFTALADPSFFPEDVTIAVESGMVNLKEMVSRWTSYLEQGVFSLSVPVDTPLGGNEASKPADFWTSSKPYWNMETEAPGAFETLRTSGLVIFKGDLNYRKLTGDVRWPAWTSFEEAIGPLAGKFPLLSLRTNKADVVVGVDKDVAEKLDASGEKWRVEGRYALVSFLPRSQS